MGLTGTSVVVIGGGVGAALLPTDGLGGVALGFAGYGVVVG